MQINWLVSKFQARFLSKLGTFCRRGCHLGNNASREAVSPRIFVEKEVYLHVKQSALQKKKIRFGNKGFNHHCRFTVDPRSPCKLWSESGAKMAPWETEATGCHKGLYGIMVGIIRTRSLEG